MSAEQEPDGPTHPSETPTRAEFAHALRDLRSWSGLTLQDVRDLQPRLRVATSSDYERGVRLPGWEWTYDFVTACLTHPKPPRDPLAPDRLRAELGHWQTAWSHAKKQPPHEPEAREHVQQAAEPASLEPARPETAGLVAADPEPAAEPMPTSTPEAPAAPVVGEPAGGDPDSAGFADLRHQDAPSSAAAGTSRRRRGRLLAAAALVVVLAAGTAATATGMFGPSPHALPPATVSQLPPTASDTPTAAATDASPTPVQAPVRVIGTADDLPTPQGIDLDNGQTLDQLTPGVDISFSSSSTHLDSMGVRSFFAVLPEPAPEERSSCEQVTDWTRDTYPDVYSLTEGRNVCVKTDEGRLSMITVTRRATPATKTISLRFTTWE
jgi:hypothetical protein